MCDNQERLVSYLYAELDAADIRTFETHLAACAECREELAGLQSTRTRLTSWAPPEPDFGFRIVRGASAPPPAPRRWFSPAWGLAAAAVLVLAGAAAIAHVEIRYGHDGLVLRTGWSRGATATSSAPAGERPTAPTVAPVDWKAEFEKLDRRLNGLEASAAASRAGNPVVLAATGPGMSEADLRRVRDMLGRSEARQQRELTQTINTLARQVDTQRRLDFAIVQQVVQGASSADLARHTQTQRYVDSRFAQQQAK